MEDIFYRSLNIPQEIGSQNEEALGDSVLSRVDLMSCVWDMTIDHHCSGLDCIALSRMNAYFCP